MDIRGEKNGCGSVWVPPTKSTYHENSHMSFRVRSNFGEMWCWISTPEGTSTYDTFLWRMIAGKGVELLCFVLVTCTYVPTVLRMRRMSFDDSSAVRRISFVPGAFIILRLPSFIRTLMDLFASPDECSEILSILQAIGDPSQGTVNGLIYATECFGRRKGGGDNNNKGSIDMESAHESLLDSVIDSSHDEEAGGWRAKEDAGTESSSGEEGGGS